DRAQVEPRVRGVQPGGGGGKAVPGGGRPVAHPQRSDAAPEGAGLRCRVQVRPRLRARVRAAGVSPRATAGGAMVRADGVGVREGREEAHGVVGETEAGNGTRETGNWTGETGNVIQPGRVAFPVSPLLVSRAPFPRIRRAGAYGTEIAA